VDGCHDIDLLLFLFLVAVEFTEPENVKGANVVHKVLEH
jgi:hypothetical protein